MTDCTNFDNHADTRGTGGGLSTGGHTTLTNCTGSGNSALYGGGILTVLGTVTLNSGASVARNRADNIGGVYNESPGKLILNSGASLTQNTAGGESGIYHQDAQVHGAVTLTAGSLVCGNSAPQCVNFTPASGFCGACP